MLLSSCEVYKKAITTDRSKTETLTERFETYRKGDTVTINVPNVIYKDTIIEKINYETKTIARIKYDDFGNKSFDCISSEIKELKEFILTQQQNNISSKKETEKQFKPQYFIYSIVILIIVLIGFMFFIQKSVSKSQYDLLNTIKDSLNN